MTGSDYFVVAVDGPSGAGKSSVSKGIARRFGLQYLDTGAMYRAATWYVLDRGVDPHNPTAVIDSLDDFEIVSGTNPENPMIQVGETDVSDPIRGDAVTRAVSLVSAIPAVRERMVVLQQQAVQEAIEGGAGIVVEGRDIGTVVLPNADVKVYLTADTAVRAERRAAEDAELAHGTTGVDATEESLRRRDELDSTRKSSPLRAAEDAAVVDATFLTLDETIEAVAEIVESAKEPK